MSDLFSAARKKYLAGLVSSARNVENPDLSNGCDNIFFQIANLS